jgi:hypothetical protein
MRKEKGIAIGAIVKNLRPPQTPHTPEITMVAVTHEQQI